MDRRIIFILFPEGLIPNGRNKQNPMQAEKATIYFSSTRMMMVAPHLQYEPHQHAALQLTFSLDDQPFEFCTASSEWEQSYAVVINSNITHSLRNFSGWQVTLLILPETIQGAIMKEKILENAAYVHVDHTVFKELLPALLELRISPGLSSEELLLLSNKIFQQICHTQENASLMDERISKTIEFIRANLQDSFSAADLAQRIFLSEDRFLHLFKEQTGMPLRQYILWQRMGLAFHLFMEGKSLKESSFEAGFSDPAHFSRSFSQVYGIAPSSYAGLKQHYRYFFLFP